MQETPSKQGGQVGPDGLALSTGSSIESKTCQMEDFVALQQENKEDQDASRHDQSTDLGRRRKHSGQRCMAGRMVTQANVWHKEDWLEDRDRPIAQFGNDLVLYNEGGCGVVESIPSDHLLIMQSVQAQKGQVPKGSMFPTKSQ